MARYIDVDILCNSLRESYNRLFELYKKAKDNAAATICEAELNTFMECIIRAKTQPTADVVEVKHGEWIVAEECKTPLSHGYISTEKTYICPFCTHHFRKKMKFCGECGAKMDGRSETE